MEKTSLSCFKISAKARSTTFWRLETTKFLPEYITHSQQLSIDESAAQGPVSDNSEWKEGWGLRMYLFLSKANIDRAYPSKVRRCWKRRARASKMNSSSQTRSPTCFPWVLRVPRERDVILSTFIEQCHMGLQSLLDTGNRQSHCVVVRINFNLAINIQDCLVIDTFYYLIRASV